MRKCADACDKMTDSCEHLKSVARIYSFFFCEHLQVFCGSLQVLGFCTKTLFFVKAYRLLRKSIQDSAKIYRFLRISALDRSLQTSTDFEKSTVFGGKSTDFRDG